MEATKDREKTEKARERAREEILRTFRTALDDDGIVLLLQPKYSATTERIVGAEALARIEDENGELLSPGAFVPVLEESGMISELDLAMVRRTAAIQKKWLGEGRALLPVSVNLSRKDFLVDGFINRVDDIVTGMGIPRTCMEFELTETAVVENFDVLVSALEKLHALGYRISLDDFGTGFSSLYVLNQIPADVIKFDRGFVLYSIHNDTGRTILKNLIRTFQEVHFEVICEGVETRAERDAIVDCGCTIIQGFLYDQPLEVEVFEGKYL